MTTTPVSYPNREHYNEDKAARRRAGARLDLIATELAMLRKRIETEQADGADTATITTLVRDLSENFAIIGTLRQVREWHAADAAEAAS